MRAIDMCHRKLRRPWRALALAALACLAAGCNRDARVTVQGLVTLNGQVVDQGKIRFEPADGATTTAEAVITAGKYSVETMLGPKKVQIEGYKKVGEKQHDPTDPSSPVLPVWEPLVPEKYNKQSTLTFKVEGKTSSANFELTAP